MTAYNNDRIQKFILSLFFYSSSRVFHAFCNAAYSSLIMRIPSGSSSLAMSFSRLCYTHSVSFRITSSVDSSASRISSVLYSSQLLFSHFLTAFHSHSDDKSWSFRPWLYCDDWAHTTLSLLFLSTRFFTVVQLLIRISDVRLTVLVNLYLLLTTDYIRFKKVESSEFRIETEIRVFSFFNPSARPGLVHSQL